MFVLIWETIIVYKKTIVRGIFLRGTIRLEVDIYS